MSPEAALDNFAFMVSLQLMGPDARRRLRVALARDPGLVGPPGFDVERVERLDDLAEGRRQPETLQDHLDLRKAAVERMEPPFGTVFWLARNAELVGAGFEPEQAGRLVEEVRGRVEPVIVTPALEEGDV
ncbi:MAG: hypothetical protein QOH81_1100 [Sphingomonadales bacterium]|jgi:hypothetical protein|nr:hypothetical protein [Sphingomonadales bacterium]